MVQNFDLRMNQIFRSFLSNRSNLDKKAFESTSDLLKCEYNINLKILKRMFT